MKEKCCKTCIHSRWPLTETGRISRLSTARCEAPIPDAPVLPDSVTKAYGYNPKPWNKSRMEQEDGVDCPCYEVNNGKPIPIK
jgi:hypothetical protein